MNIVKHILRHLAKEWLFNEDLPRLEKITHPERGEGAVGSKVSWYKVRHIGEDFIKDFTPRSLYTDEEVQRFLTEMHTCDRRYTVIDPDSELPILTYVEMDRHSPRLPPTKWEPTLRHEWCGVLSYNFNGMRYNSIYHRPNDWKIESPKMLRSCLECIGFRFINYPNEESPRELEEILVTVAAYIHGKKRYQIVRTTDESK